MLLVLITSISLVILLIVSTINVVPEFYQNLVNRICNFNKLNSLESGHDRKLLQLTRIMLITFIRFFSNNTYKKFKVIFKREKSYDEILKNSKIFPVAFK